MVFKVINMYCFLTNTMFHDKVVELCSTVDVVVAFHEFSTKVQKPGCQDNPDTTIAANDD